MRNAETEQVNRRKSINQRKKGTDACNRDVPGSFIFIISDLHTGITYENN